MGMRRFSICAVTVLATLPAGGPIAQQPDPRTSPRPAHGATAADFLGCYVGAAPVFAATVAAPIRQAKSQWLVLRAPTAQPGQPLAGSGLGDVVGGSSGSDRGVVWRVRGDSIRMYQNSFPAPRWVLARTSTGLSGRAIFEGDYGEPERTEWPARLRRVPCTDVPIRAR